MDDKCKPHESRVKALALDVPGTKQGGWAALHSSGEISVGDIQFDPTQSEAACYRELYALLDRLSPEILVLEWPFLWVIATNLGVVKGWAAMHHVGWWQIQPSRAKKLILGRGNLPKKDVQSWARARLGREVTTHVADSLLYLETWKRCRDRGEC